MLEALYANLKSQLLSVDGMTHRPYVPKSGAGPQGGIEEFTLNGNYFAGLRLTEKYLMFYLMPIYLFSDLDERYGERLKPVRSGKSCLKITRPQKLDMEAVSAILTEGAARWQ